MCGIAGIYNISGRPVDIGDLLKMTRLVRHRGPDDEGFALIDPAEGKIKVYAHDESSPAVKLRYETLPAHTTHPLALGFRRLSIIDLSELGHQPMQDESGQFCLTMNGEIYNYIELREELRGLGHRFHTQSDSEVFIKAYRQWGADALTKCVGMFALALWDNRKKILLLARDRLGKKPLNYFYYRNRLIWASEEKQIVSVLGNDKSVNKQQLLAFLYYGHSFESNETFFSEIKQLSPGHYAVVDQHGFKEYRYWKFPFAPIVPIENFETAKEKFLDQLKNAVHWRLRSDVPVGIALSGGLDSSSIACVARACTSQAIHTFSVYYPGDKYDERKYIDEVLKLGGFSPNYSTQDDKLTLTEISDFIYHQDAPVSSGSPLSAYRNYRNVRACGIVVLLNGQGGDELFAGYPYYQKYYWAQLFKTLRLSRLLIEMHHSLKYQGIGMWAKNILLSTMAVILPPQKLRALESKKYFKRKWHNAQPASIGKSELILPGWEDLNRVLLYSLTSTHMPQMLHWEDRNSMAHSIESRVPYLDHRMVELAFNIPADFKIRHNTHKYIVRQAFQGIVPQPILNRRDKIGFGTPTDVWTSTVLKKDIENLFSDRHFLQSQYWPGPRIFWQYLKNPSAFGVNEIWRFLTAELWLKNFFN